MIKTYEFPRISPPTAKSPSPTAKTPISIPNEHLEKEKKSESIVKPESSIESIKSSKPESIVKPESSRR